MESLARVVRNDVQISGIQFLDKEKKISLIADDTLLTVAATENCMEEVNNVLDAFSVISGLKVNYTKSNVVRFGSNVGGPPES